LGARKLRKTPKFEVMTTNTATMPHCLTLLPNTRNGIQRWQDSQLINTQINLLSCL
jgi:hypothetical protein